MTIGSQTDVLPVPGTAADTVAEPKGSSPSTLPCARLAAALLCGLLLWMCYFPLAWGWLAWGALVPLLTLVRAEITTRKLLGCAWVAGLVFFWPILQWMRVADERMYYCWGLLATYCSLYFPAALLLIRWLDRGSGWPLVLTVPLVWTALEFVRSFLLTGFAWYFLGHSQHIFLPIIQIADLGGAYAVTFVVAAVNALVFELFNLWPGFRSFWRLPANKPSRASLVWVQMPLVAGLVVAALGYGLWRCSQDNFTPGPRVALLQGSLDQRFRNKAFVMNQGQGDPKNFLFQYYRALGFNAKDQHPLPDLIIWPETSFPYLWYEMPAKLDGVAAGKRDYQILLGQMVREMARKECQTNLLMGLNCLVVDEKDQETQYNSALLVNRTGNLGGRYDKIHRVPFGEYVPWKDWLTFLNRLAPYDFDYSIQAGAQLTRLVLPVSAPRKADEYRFGVLICFEDTDPFLARSFGRPTEDGPAVDFLVNISNDGWFDGTSEHEEHLAIARFRAVECRRALARAVNMGISALIDGNGRVLQPEKAAQIHEIAMWTVADQDGQVPDLPPGRWAEFKKLPGVLSATIPLDKRISLYSRWGDWLPVSCWGLIGVGLTGSFLRARRGKKPTGLAKILGNQ